MANTVTSTEYSILNKAVSEYINNGIITLKCPRCGEPLIYEINGSLEIIRCKNPTCIKSIRRGI